MPIVSRLYKGLTALRGFLSEFGVLKGYRSSLPIVCIGNAVVGGSGKTPLVRALAGELSKRGFSPVVLSRGYLGKCIGPVECSPHHPASEIGDEPALLVRSGVRVVVSKNKLAGVRFIEEQKKGDVILLDDGFQHLRLARDCNILVIPATASIDDLTFPAGRLRESYRAALRRTDFAVFSQKNSEKREKVETFKKHLRAEFPEIQTAELQFLGVRVSQPGIESGRSSENLAVCHLMTAVGDPQSVKESLRSAGWEISGESLYRDHHRFSQEDFRRVLNIAKHPIVVTEKDAVKLVDLGITDFRVLKVDVEPSAQLLKFVCQRIYARRKEIQEELDRGKLCDEIMTASPLKRQKVVQIGGLARDLSGKILDLGCDNGAVSFALRRLGGEWQTGDLDGEVIEGAKVFLGDSAREINPSKLEFADGALDAVVVIDMFEHLSDDRELVGEIHRILKDSGILIINVPNPHRGLIRRLRYFLGQTDQVHGHLRPGYTLEDLTTLLGGRFKIEKSTGYSRAATELADTLVTLGVDLLKSAKHSSQKGRVVSAADTSKLQKAVRLGRLIAPVLNAALVFDYLFPFTATNLLVVRARKI